MTRELPADLELTDGVVTLRRWQASDTGVLTAIWQDDELQRRFGVPTPVTTGAINAYILGVEERWGAGAQVSLAVVAGGELVGGVDLDDLDTEEPDLGYWVAADHRGRGLAARSARLVLDWAARDLEHATIRLVVEPDNAASIAVAEVFGFRRVPGRTEIDDDRRLDVYLLTISR